MRVKIGGTMIHDKMSNLLKVIPLEKQVAVAKFLELVSSVMAEGKYDIDGEDVFARIMSYNTKLEENCVVEAHDTYVDIQFSLVGEEGISMYSREELELISSDKENDFNTFEVTDAMPEARICNRVGWFTMLRTNEAHRPQESTDRNCQVVKKGVIKIKEKCYE